MQEVINYEQLRKMGNARNDVAFRGFRRSSSLWL